MATKYRLSPLWIGALVACGAGTVFLIGLPRKTPEPQPWVPPANGVTPANGPVRPPVDGAALEAVFQVIAPPVGAKDIERAKMVERIYRSGPRTVPVLIALMCGEATMPETAAGTLDQPIDPRALEMRDVVVREALARFDAGQRLAALRERAIDAPLDVRLALSRVLAETDHADAVRTWLELTRGVEPIHWQRAFVYGPLEDALAASLARRPQSCRDLRVASRDADPGMLAMFARAAARVNASTSAGLLVDLLDRSPELDVEVLKALMTIGRTSRLALPSDALDAVRRKLADSDPAVERAAIDALGANGDDGSVDALVEALSSEDPLIARAAVQALTSIAGAQLGPDPAMWKQWRDQELGWCDRALTKTLAELEGSSPAQVVKAMQELAAHPLVRHAAAEAIAPLVDSGDDSISRAACEALTVLGSGRAIPALIETLGNEDETRRNRANGVLAHLTGFALPPDGAAWSEALSSVKL